jgi:hypothetical protein
LLRVKDDQADCLFGRKSDNFGQVGGSF